MKGDGVDVEVLQDLTQVALPNAGYLRRRRVLAKTVLPDGSRTAPYVVDWVERAQDRVDAVAVCVYASGRTPENPVVVLRRQLRVAMHRAIGHAMCLEVVAGLIEGSESPEVAAAKEVYEEAGLRVPLDAIRRLGQPIFPVPASFTERIHLCAVEVAADQLSPERLEPPPTDGSPMEEGADLWTMPLTSALALAQVEPGHGPHGLFLVDAKTELILHRLKEDLRR
ncbi:MAG: NUDIX domain-containing protein [Myxococcota bacterium]